MSESEINSLANGDYFSCLDQRFPSISILKLNRLIHTYIQIHKNYRIGKYWTVQRVCKGYLPGDPNNSSRCTSSVLCLSSVALNCFQVKIVCTFGSPIVVCIFYVLTFKLLLAVSPYSVFIYVNIGVGYTWKCFECHLS